MFSTAIGTPMASCACLMPHQPAHSGVGERNGEQVVEHAPIGRAERQMVRMPRATDPLDEAADLAQVGEVKRIRPAERQRKAVGDDWVPRGEERERVRVVAALPDVVLGAISMKSSAGSVSTSASSNSQRRPSPTPAMRCARARLDPSATVCSALLATSSPSTYRRRSSPARSRRQPSASASREQPRPA